VDGLRRAALRLGTARTTSTPEAFYALFESLAWAGAVCDRLRDEKQPLPPTLGGLWYVRNLVLHQGADVLLRITGVYGSAIVGGGVLGEKMLGSAGRPETRSRFPPIDDLPPGRSKAGRLEYMSHVQELEANTVFARAIGKVERL